MNNFQLVETQTNDKLIHQGLYAEPVKRSSSAILWVHGLSSTFYSNIKLLNEFAKQSNALGFGFASFNNRGHDLISGIRQIDAQNPKGYKHINGGAGYENFADCVWDIKSGVDFLLTQGFSHIYIVGHSTGALKTCYYAGHEPDTHVSGVVLSGFVSDRLDPSFDTELLKKTIDEMKQLISQGKGNELIIGKHFFPLTPKRYISLFEPHQLEDQADYGEESPHLTYFRRIKKPLLVLLGERDEYLDRPAQEVLNILKAHTASSKFSGQILPKALHSFNGTESEAVQKIFEWIQYD